MSAHFDVAIIGLGPVGAVAANLCARQGLKTLVVERDRVPYTLPRAIHFDAEIMRVFQSLGVADAITKVSRPLGGSVYLGVDGKPIREMNATDTVARLGWSASHLFYQPKLEAILREKLLEYSNVDIRLETTCTDIDQGGDKVTLSLSGVNSKTPTLATASYVLACDGAKSVVRKSLGIELEDLKFDEPWLVVDAMVHGPMRWPDKYEIPEKVRNGNHSLMVCDPDRPSTIIPGPGKHRRWEFMLKQGETAESMTEEKVNSLVGAWVDLDDIEIVRAAVYRFHGLIAKEWRAERIFLLGDAAHQTPPFYGQGMCHGIRDAANLVWKLKLLTDGIGDDRILDSFEEERRPHVQAIIKASITAGSAICIQDRERALARDQEFREAKSSRKAPSSMVDVVGPLRNGIFADLRENPQDRAQGKQFIQPRVRDDDGKIWRLDDKLDYRPAIIGIDTNPIQNASRQLQRHWKRIGGVTIVIRSVGAEIEKSKCHDVEYLTDIDGVLMGWFSDYNAGAILLRPDRYVFGASSSDGGEQLVEKFCAGMEFRPRKPMEGAMGVAGSLSLNHFGIYVTDIDKMVDFYTEFLGFVVTDRRTDVNPICFMTMSENEHHQLLLASGRKEGQSSTVNQISFLVPEFSDVRRMYEKAEADPRTTDLRSLDHGNSWAIYFRDPEDNMIEIYAHTPWHVDQPYGIPIDFSLSDDAIIEKTKLEVEKNPTFMTAAEFKKNLRLKLDGRQ